MDIITGRHLEILVKLSQLPENGELSWRSFPSTHSDAFFDLVNVGYLERDVRNFVMHNDDGNMEHISFEEIPDFRDDLYVLESRAFYSLTKKGREYVGDLLRYASGIPKDDRDEKDISEKLKQLSNPLHQHC